MPPDARMSVAQQLLLRALIARFWREPYAAGLTRWGTELHDRFMLPYFIALDFDDVIEELRRAGYPLSSDWFAPHLEFRFPLAGELSARAIHLTLRQALEPWHVLGEEGAAGGTARFVDSSLERLQVLVTGLTGDRFVITCNGRPLPLQPTGRNGEFVAGVRYRAWQPPSALHPTIPVHTPLTFDIVDTWMERSVAGCQYHVMHPGGRNYDQFPVNSYEAESRRLARFTRLAHTPGRVQRRPSGAEPGVPVHAGSAYSAVTRAAAVAGLRRARRALRRGADRRRRAASAVGGIRRVHRAARGVPVPGAEARRPANRRERRHLQRLRDRRRVAASVEPRRPAADRAGAGVGACSGAVCGSARGC